MSGTTALTAAQFATLARSVEECGMGVQSMLLHPAGANRIVAVEFTTPGFGVLSFRIDQHGKRLPKI